MRRPGISKLTYTYQEIAQEFHVTVETIRRWKQAGLFKIIGYRRLGRWAKQAVVSTEEVKRLINTKYPKKR